MYLKQVLFRNECNVLSWAWGVLSHTELCALGEMHEVVVVNFFSDCKSIVSIFRYNETDEHEWQW